MSSLDRAFFRAYAKEEPLAAAADAAATAPQPAVSPYVDFQASRKPQLRYRLEPTHAPWGQGAAPHIEVAPLQTSYESDDYRLATDADDGTVSAAWSHSGEAHLLSLAAPPPTQLPPAEPTAHVRTWDDGSARQRTSAPLSAMDSYAEGIVCWPGMTIPESNYLATLVPAEPAESETAAAPVAPIAATVEAAASRTEAPSPPQPEAALPAEPAVAEPAPQAVAETSVTSHVEPATMPGAEPDAPPAGDAEAFWEVDRYLYPALSDRLLSRYEYFSHAGDKLKQAAAAGLKVLGITGIGRDEGRSTLAICLARAAARSGLKVVLIDCDFEHPDLARQVGLDVASGWQSVATGELAVVEVAIRSLEDGITLLPLTDDATGSSLSMSDPRVVRVLAQARQAHDVVILDIGPLPAAGHAQSDAVPRRALPFDAAIVVWDRRRRKLDEAQAVAQVLSGAGVEAVGIAENFAG